jgi:excisionase family DNA binding protein
MGWTDFPSIVEGMRAGARQCQLVKSAWLPFGTRGSPVRILSPRPISPAKSLRFFRGFRPLFSGSDDSHPTETLRRSGNAPRAADSVQGVAVLPDKLLTVAAVAAQLGVCRATVYAMAERGDLPHVRIGNTVRIAPADLAALIGSRS